MPDDKLARRFRTALDQETHLVPERALAERILNLLATAHLLTINRENQFPALYPGPRQLAFPPGRQENESGRLGFGGGCVAPRVDQ